MLPVLPFGGPANNLLGSSETLLMEMIPIALCMSSSLKVLARKHLLLRKFTISAWWTSHSPRPARWTMWSGREATLQTDFSPLRVRGEQYVATPALS